MVKLPDILFSNAPIRWLQDLVGTDHALPFRLLSQLGDTWGILLVIAVARWWYGRRPGATVAVAAGLAAPLWLGLATLFSVERPAGPGIRVFEQVDVGAFPSGHVFHTVLLWSVLAALSGLPRWLPVALGALTGLGRLYLGVHYVGDVVGALLLAPLFALGFVRLRDRLPLEPDRWPTAVWAGVAAAATAVVAALLIGPVDPGTLRDWEILGFAVGGPAALALHYGRGRSRRAEATGHAPAAKLAGLVGLLALALCARLLGSSVPAIAGAATVAALILVFAAVPATARARHASGRLSASSLPPYLP